MDALPTDEIEVLKKEKTERRFEKKLKKVSRIRDFKASARVLISEIQLLRPNLRSNSYNSLCHVIDSCTILDSTYELRPNENKTDLGWFSSKPECAISNREIRQTP